MWREPWLALINALMAVLMIVAMPLWPFFVANAVYESEVRHNIEGDAPMMALISGFILAPIVFGPSAALFKAASVGMWKGGRHAGRMQVLAILSLIWPAIVVVLSATVPR
jgi:hypothetical protein